MKKEASLAANISGPSGQSRPKTDRELDFDEAVSLAELNDSDVDEVVRRRGDAWVFYDDDTESERGVYKDRQTAWKQQRIYRRMKMNNSKKKNKEQIMYKATDDDKHPKHRKNVPSPRQINQPPKKESVQYLANLIKESMLTYMFEQPENRDSERWESVISNISKDVVMSDTKLKPMLTNIAKAEVRALIKGFKELEKESDFELKSEKPKVSPDTNEIELHFTVTLKNNKRTYKLSLQIQNGLPTVVIPDNIRKELNSISDNEVKLLKTELSFVQEKKLNQIDDVVVATSTRDTYLTKLEGKLDKQLKRFSGIELAILRNLLETKYKSVK